MSSSGRERPSTCFSMQWWHEVDMEHPILLRHNKCDHDTFMNAHGSPEALQSISKVEFVIMFSEPYIVLVSIVVKQHIKWVMWSPLSMIQ